MKEKQFGFRGAKINYKIVGNGMPVVLIHGFSEDSTVWENQIGYLKNEYRLIIPDLAGSGKSGLIETDVVGLEDHAECIHEMLQIEKIDRCIMIGHSMGGYITLAFAEKHPGSLIAFGLFHSSAYADDAAKVETRKKAIEFIHANGVLPFLKTSIPGLFNNDNPGFQQQWPDNLIQKGTNFSARALVQYYEAMIARPDRTEILKKSSVPVLLIMGQHDKAVPFKQSLEQSHMPGHVYVHILRESAHMGMLEESGKANEILANFLRSQKA